jgi:hypothetical protein
MAEAHVSDNDHSYSPRMTARCVVGGMLRPLFHLERNDAARPLVRAEKSESVARISMHPPGVGAAAMCAFSADIGGGPDTGGRAGIGRR